MSQPQLVAFALVQVLCGIDHERKLLHRVAQSTRPSRSLARAVRAEASLDAGTLARIKREATVVGKTEFVLDAELTDTDGVVVAVTQGTYQVRTIASIRKR